MYARVISITLRPEMIDEVISIYQSSIVPTAQAQKGCHSVSLLINRETGKGHSITFWDTEADMKAGETSEYLRGQIAKVSKGFATQPVIEGFEVTAHAD